MKWSILFCTALLLAAAVSCQRAPSAGRSSGNLSQTGTQQVFQVKGIVKKVEADGKTIEIRHEEIPDYMPAMTMPFEAKNPKELAGLKDGDAVSFRLTVTETDSWIDQIRQLSSAGHGTNGTTVSVRPNTAAPVTIIRAAEPLQIGDPLPEYHFTNQLGQAIGTKQFKGQALAITFVF